MYDYGELNWFQFKQLNEIRNLPLQQQVNRFNSYINELSNNLHSISSVANSSGAAAGGYQETTTTSTTTTTTTAAPTTTSTTTTTTTAVQLFQSYNYSISATDLADATNNTGGNTQYNNKVVVVITNGYNCGNTTERNFTYSFSAAGSSYIAWLISRKTNVPVIGYYKNDTLVTAGVISTQTINATVPC